MVFITKADGSVIIDTKLNTDGFGKGASNLKSQFASLSSSAGKLGAALGAAFSVKAIVDFSKKALELGSDLQEVQNVVDVTFTTMSQKVNEFAQNAAKTAGLSETMAKRYIGTFGAMSKSFGFSENEAYNMSATLTQLTGDVASFYNLTQDVAYTKLKSVFTGETESLKDLGVVMTQTALDEFAMRKGFKKTTQQMSEQEKVVLRYQFVLDQLSGASGDFVRTQDVWANQIRILKLQVESLLATFGQGLINVLTPALKVLNSMISKLQEFANVFKRVTEALFGNASEASGNVDGSIESAANNAEQLEENISNAGKAAKKSFAGFDEINVLSGETLDSGSEESIIPTGGANNEDKKDVSGAGKIADGLLKVKENLQQFAKPIIEFAAEVKKVLGWVWMNVLKPLGKWVIEKAAPESVGALSSALEGLSSTTSVIFGAFQKVWVKLQPIFQWIGDTVLVVLGDLKEIGDGVAKKWKKNAPKIEKTFENIGNVIEKVWKVIGPILTWLRDGLSEIAVDTPINDLQYIIDLLYGLSEIIAGLFNLDIGQIFNGFGALAKAELDRATNSMRTYANAVGIDTDALDQKIRGWAKNVGKKFSDAWLSVKEIWGDVSTWFDTNVIAPVKNAFEPIGQWFSDLLTEVETTFSDVFYNIGVIAGGCWETIQIAWQEAGNWFDENIIQPIGNFFNELWTDISTWAEDSWKKIQEKLQPYVTWIDEEIVQPISEFFSGLWDGIKQAASDAAKDVKEAFSGIGQFFKDILNGIIESLNNALSWVFGGINDILSELKDFKIAGKKTFGKIKEINIPQIPYLAKGAVIPPNAPFMAVLGDQRRGTNIEAPLDTIKQALAEVMAMQESGETVVTVNFTGDLSQLARVLKPKIDAETRRKGNSLASGGAY